MYRFGTGMIDEEEDKEGRRAVSLDLSVRERLSVEYVVECSL